MAIDTGKLQEFLGRFVTDLGATFAAGSVVTGHRDSSQMANIAPGLELTFGVRACRIPVREPKASHASRTISRFARRRRLLCTCGRLG